MQTLIIYDNTGMIWNITYGQYVLPEGLTATIMDVPEGSQVQSIDVSGEAPKLVFASLPENDIVAMKAEMNALRTENAFMSTALTFAAETFTDDQALKVPTLYEEWSGNSISYKVGKRLRHEGNLYRVVKDHKSQSDWIPGSTGTESLYTKIEESHAGTLEDPIPASTNLEYIKGKYYIEEGIIYLMNRQGMADGESITLQHMPSQLVGQYFEII